MTAQEAYAELISIRKNREDGYLTHLSCGGKADEHYCRQCGQALDWSDTNA